MSRLTALFRYFILDAWDEWRHSPGVNLLASGTLVAALFVAGLVLLLLGNLDLRLQRLREQLRIDVYLVDGLEEDRRETLQTEFQETPGVSGVEYIGKKEALVRFRDWFAELADLPEELGDNPLPASFEVYLESGRDASSTAEELVQQWSGLEGVEEVRFDRQWLDRMGSLLGLARIGGTMLAMLVFGAVVFVIASVLRLAVYARRDEARL